MTQDEAIALVQQLGALDYNDQADRNVALQIISQVSQLNQLPPMVATAVAAAQQRLDAGGGVADQTPRDFRRRSEFLFGIFDHVPMAVALSPLDMMDTARGKRYTEALLTASQAGDPAALRRVADILNEDDAVPENVRDQIAGAIEQVVEETDLANADTTPEPGSPESRFNEYAAAFGSTGGRFYGVPEMTLDEEGVTTPWEALIGDQSVAPQYPTGWSMQPQRFGLNNEESIARAQILMEDMGLLRPGEYLPGVWDIRTAGRNDTQGWRAVLSFANMTGISWEDSFSRLYDAGTDAAARGLQMDLERLSRTPFFEDPEKLRDRTRRFLRAMGRQESQIMDEELDQIMNMAARGSQQSMMGALTEQVERQGMVGPQGDVALGALQGGEGLPAAPLSEAPIDPISHFDNALRQVMGREIESREAQEEATGGAPRMARTAGMIGSARG